MKEELGLDEEEINFSEDLDVTLDSHHSDPESEDPYLQLGFGMCAYFNLLRTFIFVFLLLSVLSVPALVIYSSHDGMKGLRNYERSQFSVGNIGFADSVCNNYYIGITSPITFK